ncbi:diguanylate cyclase domain-containing protein [Actinoplanes palleronii]|uniref:diguanylate cyclase domain-containing protein n=1 Tax=Actinoplanes palleronii TaxID=113570 RepID=UPI001944FCFD|nr:diguanylate cyclase [Actinoplanes palleronii]
MPRWVPRSVPRSLTRLVPRSLTRDPVLAGLLVLTGLVLVGYLTPVGGSWGRLLAFWPIQIALDVVMLVGSYRVVRLPDIPADTRRFWRSMTMAGVLLTLSDVVQAAQNLRHITPALLNSGNLQLALIAAGIAGPIWTMLTHPIPGLRREKLRFWLDAGATIIAAAVFIWTLLMPDLDSRGGAGLLLYTASSAAMLVAAFGVVKLTLADNPPFNRGAAITGGLGACLVGVCTVVAPPVEESWALHLFMVSRLVPCVLLAACSRFQEIGLRADAAAGGGTRPARRRHSPLPYVAAIAAQFLMIVLLFRSGLPLQLAGGVIGVTVVIGLVIARQLVTFADVDTLVTEVSRQEQRFRALVRHASDVTLVVDRAGSITYASPALHRVLGLPAETVTGTRLADILHPDDATQFDDVVLRSAADPDRGVPWRARARHSDGGWRWLEIISTNRLDDPSVDGIISNARDITLARDLEQQLRHQASHDQLTGLANRLLFTERLDRIARDPVIGSPPGGDAGPDRLVGMLAIDLNDFKPINDTLGHQAGDTVLMIVAHRLSACAGDTATVARLGGDEFAVILHPTSVAETAAMADRVRAAIAEPMHVAGQDLTVGASIGVATGPPNAAEELHEAADAAMYETKRDAKASR